MNIYFCREVSDEAGETPYYLDALCVGMLAKLKKCKLKGGEDKCERN